MIIHIVYILKTEINNVSSDLFSHMKEDLEGSKVEIVDKEFSFDLSRILVITDGFDDLDERFAITEILAKRFNSEYTKVYLYNLKGSMFNRSEEEELSVLDSLRAHSNKIKELKSKNVAILFDETLKSFLIEYRDIRQVSAEEITEFSIEDVEALTEFFLEKSNRDYNLIQEINKYIDEYNPNLVYWKPNLMEDRKWNEEIGISNIESLILRHVYDNSLVFLEGENKFTDARNLVCFIEGGEVEVEYRKIIKTIQGCFQGTSVNVSFCVIISQHTLNLADSSPEGQKDEKGLREQITEKISNQIKQIRIFNKSPDLKIHFGQIDQELEAVLRDLDGDILVVSPKNVGEDKFDSRSLGVIKIAIKQGLGVLAII